jgi:protein SCO1
LGLSGTKEQVKSICKAYRVYFSALDEEGDDYLVDHSIITYLIDPSGQYSGIFGQIHTSDDIANKTIKAMKEYEEESSSK